MTPLVICERREAQRGTVGLPQTAANFAAPHKCPPANQGAGPTSTARAKEEAAFSEFEGAEA
jgi:hypothetical protein